MASDISNKTRRSLKSALAFGSLSKIRHCFLRHSSLLSPIFPQNRTILHLACMENRLDVVMMAAKEFKASLAMKDDQGNGLSAWARFYRNADLAEYIDSNGGGEDVTNCFRLGEVEIRLERKQLFSHCNDRQFTAPIHTKLSLKNLFRVYKQQTYRVIAQSNEHSVHGSGLAYGIRKGFLPIETDPLAAFVGHFIRMDSQSSLEIVLGLIPDRLLDVYLTPFISEIGQHNLSILLTKFSARVSPSLLMSLSRVLRVTSSRKTMIFCQNPEMFSLLPDLLCAKALQKVERECDFENYRCSFPRKPCKRTLSLMLLISKKRDYFVMNSHMALKQIATTCLHDKGVIDHLRLLGDSGVMPSERISLGWKDVNLILNIDMLEYHRLISKYFSDFQPVFSFSEYPKVHKDTLLRAVRLFNSTYPDKLSISLTRQLQSIVLQTFTRKNAPKDFAVYLDSHYDLENYVRRTHAELLQTGAFRKLMKSFRSHRRLWLLFTRKWAGFLQRLPGALTRHLCSYL